MPPISAEVARPSRTSVAGVADAVLRVVAADVPHLEQVVSRLRALPHVQQTATTMLLPAPVRRPAVTSPPEG